MSEKCELLNNCGFFLNFKGNSDAINKGWIRMYCENLEKSNKCKRKEIRKKTGKPPADNMSPTGKLL